MIAIDKRHCNTAEEMFEAIVDHLGISAASGSKNVYCTFFRPQTPGTNDGPRIWNRQLIRYAGHKQSDGSVIGDQMEVPFTEMLKKNF